MFGLPNIISGVFAKTAQWVRDFFQEAKEVKASWQGKQLTEDRPLPIRPEWINTPSSYVKGVRYDSISRKLEVNYLGKKVCKYSNISHKQFMDFLSSDSLGRWARSHLFPLPYS